MILQSFPSQITHDGPRPLRLHPDWTDSDDRDNEESEEEEEESETHTASLG